MVDYAAHSAGDPAGTAVVGKARARGARAIAMKAAPAGKSVVM
jgi:hypothetical protein